MLLPPVRSFRVRAESLLLLVWVQHQNTMPLVRITERREDFAAHSKIGVANVRALRCVIEFERKASETLLPSLTERYLGGQRWPVHTRYSATAKRSTGHAGIRRIERRAPNDRKIPVPPSFVRQWWASQRTKSERGDATWPAISYVRP